MRALFVNENIGGHATMHEHLRRALAAHPGVCASFVDVQPRGLGRRLAGAAVPGLARLDLDFAALRGQLALSLEVRRSLGRVAEAPDVLHVYTQNAGLLSTGFLRRQASVVSTDATTTQSARILPYRAPGPGTPAAVSAARAFERRVYDSATLVVAQSAWAATSLRDDYGIDQDRLRVVPFGIRVPELPASEPTAPTVAFVGRSMTRKGGWRLLDLWRRRLRGRCSLTLVTPEPVPTEPGVTVLRDVRSGDGRLPKILADATVFAFPTDMDTFGYAALEAMAVATPVVTYGVAALPEVVADGETGFVVAPGDEEAFGDAVERLIDDPGLARRMGTAGRARVADHFDANATTTQLVGVLEDAVRRHR